MLFLRNRLFQISMLMTFTGFVGCATIHNTPDMHESLWSAKKDMILKDQSDIISDDFSVPSGLEKRVSFWMDIYARYDSKIKVIHDSENPWIVYEVVNTNHMPQPERHISNRLKFYRAALKKIAKGKETLNPKEMRIKELFSESPEYVKKAHRNIRYQTGQRNFIKAGIERSMLFLPHMEDIFRAHALPVELTRLPFVESSFNWKAHSKVGARGIWQFMRNTGSQFMRVDNYFDERVSPLKSTHAAAKLLKQNHRILYKEWPLAVTAYNHGPSGLRKAVKKLGSTDIAVIADDYKTRRFSFASANFYSSFLAVLYVEKYKKMIFSDIDWKQTPQILATKTQKIVPVRNLVKQIKMSEEEFLVWNPELMNAVKRNYRLPKNYTYYHPIPEQSLAQSGPTEELTTDID